MPYVHHVGGVRAKSIVDGDQQSIVGGVICQPFSKAHKRINERKK